MQIDEIRTFALDKVIDQQKAAQALGDAESTVAEAQIYADWIVTGAVPETTEDHA